MNPLIHLIDLCSLLEKETNITSTRYNSLQELYRRSLYCASVTRVMAGLCKSIARLKLLRTTVYAW